MKPCGMSGADSAYCLDDCNGYEGELSGVDEFKYRYYMSGPTADLTCSDTVTNSADTNCEGDCCNSIVPDSDYNPYAVGCYKGCPVDDFFSDDSLFSGCTEASNGYTSDYTATALTGLYEQYGAYTGADNPDGDGAVECTSDEDNGNDNPAPQPSPHPSQAPSPPSGPSSNDDDEKGESVSP